MSPLLPADLSDDAIAIWIVDLRHAELPPADGLSPDERERQSRFRTPELRARFAASRWQMRRILAPYAHCAPESVRFTYGPYGKPALESGAWQFNTSHSGDLLLVAICRDEIGVDVEQIHALNDLGEVATATFAREESALVARDPDPVGAFFRCWTLKEAYIKAIGQGFSLAPNRFVVMWDGRPRLHSVDGKPEREVRWVLYSFSPEPGYQAALAVARAALGKLHVRRV